jgi:hypothetical protein
MTLVLECIVICFILLVPCVVAIANGVEQHIAIGMGGKAQLVWNDNAPYDQGSVGGESMGIVTETYAEIRHIFQT